MCHAGGLARGARPKPLYFGSLEVQEFESTLNQG